MTYLLVYILLIFYVLKKFERRLGSLNIIFIFTLMHIVYTLMIPIELMILRDLSRFNVLRFVNLNNYIFWSFISYFGFVIPFLFLKPKSFYLLDLRNYSFFNISSKNLIYFFIPYLAIGLLFFREYFVQAGSYEGNIDLSSSPLYKYYIQIGILVFAYITMGLILSKKYISSLLPIVIVLLWSLYSSDKNPMYIVFFSSLACLGNNFKKKKSISYLLLLLLIIPITSVLFSFFRAGKISQFDVAKSIYSNSDPKGPFETILFYENQLNNKDFKPQYGLTYLESTVNWIPKFFWKTRPDDLSTKYAKNNLINYSKGLGVGFSPISEGINNFGYYGPFFGYLINSLSIVFLLYFIKIFIKNNINSMLVTYLFFLFFILMMHRSPFVLPSYLIKNFIPLLMITSFIRNIK